MNVLRATIAAIGALAGLVVLLPVLVLGAPFWVVAYLTRLLAARFEPAHLPYGQLIEFDPRFGWKPRANLSTGHLADDIFKLTTDAAGWRGRASLASSQVVVLGDSFAWGFGVDDEHFFADLDARLVTKAIGTIGYNMVQELLWLRTLAPQLGGKLVVWLVYFGNDLHENLVPDMCGYRMPFLRPTSGGTWEIETTHISPAKWPYRSQLQNERRDYYGALARLCSPGESADRAYDACRFLIGSGRDCCAAAGARLVVLTVPEVTQLDSAGAAFLQQRLERVPPGFDVRYPDKRLRRMCEDLEVEFVAGADHLSRAHYKQRDCHWNQEGHRRMAALIAELHGRQPAAAPAMRDSMVALQPVEPIPVGVRGRPQGGGAVAMATRRRPIGPPPKVARVSSNERRPFWSVMIPTRDRSDYFCEALQSVLAQDIGADEMQIAVVDNCSTHVDVPALLREIDPKGRVEYLRQAKLLDIPANWSSCIGHARGHWVHIMHDDDVLEGGFYSAYREFIDGHPEAAFVLCQVTQIDEEGRLRERMFGPPGMNHSGLIENARERLVEWDWVAPATVVARRSAYEAVGGFRPYRHVLDWEMWIRLAEFGPVGYIHAPLLRYRFHTSSATVTSLRTGNHIREIAELLEHELGRMESSRRHGVRQIARRKYAEYADFLVDLLRSRREHRAAIDHALWALRLNPGPAALRSLTDCIREAVRSRVSSSGLWQAVSNRPHE